MTRRPPPNLAEMVVKAAQSEQSASDLGDAAEIVGGRFHSQDLAGQSLRALDLKNVVFDTCRLTGAVLESSRFRRVLFVDSELTGLTFKDCYFEECIILGGKASSHVSFLECSFDSLTILSTRVGELDFQSCGIKHLRLASMHADQLRFQESEALGRTGELQMADLDVANLVGFEELPRKQVNVCMDRELWTAYGDLLLRQMRFVEMNESERETVSNLADDYRAAL